MKGDPPDKSTKIPWSFGSKPLISRFTFNFSFKCLLINIIERLSPSSFILAQHSMYGTFLVPLMITWFYIGLILALIFFGITAVFNPARTEGAMKLFGQAGKIAGKAATGKSKQAAVLEKEIAKLDSQISDANTKILALATPPNAVGPDDPQYKMYAVKIAELETKRSKLQAELDNL